MPSGLLKRFLNIEILNNINSRVKRKKNNTSITYNRPPLSIDDDDDSTLEFSNNGIIHFIRYNGSYLDFTQCVSHTLKFFSFVFRLKINFFLVTFIWLRL